MLASGVGALYLADNLGWETTYFIMAGVMGLACVLTLAMREPETVRELREAAGGVMPFLRNYVVAPFRDFMIRPLWLQVLAFVIL